MTMNVNTQNLENSPTFKVWSAVGCCWNLTCLLFFLFFSRLDYRYPPHGHWDSTDGRGYHSYYRGEHPQQQGTWRSTPKHLQHPHLQLHLNSHWCSSGWRHWTVGLTGSLVEGAAPWTTVPVGTFRELLRRGAQVGQPAYRNKMGVHVC